MRSLDQRIDKKLLLELIRDGLKGDPGSFEMRARRFASKVNKFDSAFAADLNNTLTENSVLRGGVKFQVAPPPVDSDTRQNLLIEAYPVTLSRDPILSPTIRNNLDRFLKERSKIDELLAEGLLPSRSLLLEGPPGVGKTLTAKWLASKLDLPLLTLDLATVMSSFLGKTGNNIREVLKYATSFPCILLLDEFDSIGKKRDDDSDVGELKRLVTVLLQAIDEWPVTSILVAATNHGELLDPAVWRRFDKTVHFENPDKELIQQFLEEWGLQNYVAEWLSKVAEGHPLAIIEKRVNQAKKNSLLEEMPLIDALSEEFGVNANFSIKPDKCTRNERIISMYKKGFSQRKISSELGVSRPTVRKVINDSSKDAD